MTFADLLPIGSLPWNDSCFNKFIDKYNIKNLERINSVYFGTAFETNCGRVMKFSDLSSDSEDFITDAIQLF